MIIRRILHAILITAAAIPWAIAVLLAAICLFLVVLADKLWPDATWGNCWSYVGPKWYKHGGYIGIRIADGVRVFRIGWVPHALWIKNLPYAASIEHTSPINRSLSKFLPWRIFYFPYIVKYSDYDHDAHL